MEINRLVIGQGDVGQTPKYIDEKKVSAITGRALQTLRNDRFNGRGIPYIKLSRMVRYSLQDVVDYMEFAKLPRRLKGMQAQHRTASLSSPRCSCSGSGQDYRQIHVSSMRSCREEGAVVRSRTSITKRSIEYGKASRCTSSISIKKRVFTMVKNEEFLKTIFGDDYIWARCYRFSR